MLLWVSALIVLLSVCNIGSIVDKSFGWFFGMVVLNIMLVLAVAGGNLHAEHQAESMYPAIDGLIDKVDGQLVKYKEKLKS